ncbi:MAG: hypothetical protein CSB55_06860 [Candidatus Cloacimonadota bacterium]|nr:MAG: hypothetical protein CSB55_06860 [Candidatus Cloacimonadota bacterium]
MSCEEKIDFQKALDHQSQTSGNNKKAIVSHYLYSNKDIADLYKERTIEITKEIYEVIYPNQKISFEIAESKLQHVFF